MARSSRARRARRFGTALALVWIFVACGDSDGPADSAMGGDATTDSADIPDSTSTAQAELVIDPAFWNFGSVICPEGSDAPFLVTNVGDAPAVDLRAELSGSTAFTIAANDCPPMLAVGEDCTIQVHATDEGSIGSNSASLEVSERSARVTASMMATVSHPPALTITPTPSSFGTLSVGETSDPLTLTVTALCAAGVLSVSLAGVDAAQFLIGADECSGSALAGDGTCTIEVIYAPSAAGAHSAEVTVSSSPGGSVSAAVSGEAN